jgi:hypothetical protein
MSLHLTSSRAAAGVAALLVLAAAAPAAAAPRRLLNRPVAIAAAAKKPVAAVYGGHTSQFDPIGLRVARGGRALSSVLLDVETTCDNGAGYTWAGPASFAAAPPATPGEANVFTPAKVSRAGAFSADGRALASFGDTVGLVTEHIAGRLRRGKGRGTLDVTIDVSDQAGAHVTTCHSGGLRWTTRSKPGRVYAGLTSAGGPVVVERSNDGRKVNTFWVSYAAPCQPGGAAVIGEGLTNFLISEGSFGDRWTDDEKADDGSSTHFEYVLDGDVGKTRASGVFRARLTDTDPSGAPKDTCDTAQVSWSARSTKGKVPDQEFVVIRLGS